MSKILKKILFNKISAKGMALFRIAYHMVMFLEILKIYNYRQLYFDEIPFLKPHFPDISLLFILWLGINVCQIIGYKTKLFSIINYIFTLVFIASAVNFEYHMFYTYTGINFIAIFLPLSASLSVDFLIKRRRFLSIGKIYEAPKISKINYYVPVFIGLGLVYLDSVLAYKIKSPLWLSGLGLWLPASVPQITISNNQWLLNQEIVVKTLSHVTFVFEFLFLFIFWIKKFRKFILITGLGLHLSIYFFYPIPYFALGCASIYLLIVPVSFWEKCYLKLIVKIKKTQLVPLLSRLHIIADKNETKNMDLAHPLKINSVLDTYRNYFLVLLCLLSIGLQLQVNYSAFTSRQKAYNFNLWIVKHFGITAHGVFVDAHFKGFNTIYAIKYNNEFLPIIDEQGMPSDYLTGGAWINWLYRVNKPYIQQNSPYLRKGLINYSSFWAIENNLNLAEMHRFQIVKKKIKVSFDWEKDLLKNNINSPWQNAGVLIWENYAPLLLWE